VTTGNITNDALLELIGAHLAVITDAFESSDFVELWPHALIVHVASGQISTAGPPGAARRLMTLVEPISHTGSGYQQLRSRAQKVRVTTHGVTRSSS
jgi:hypothetical protein